MQNIQGQKHNHNNSSTTNRIYFLNLLHSSSNYVFLLKSSLYCTVTLPRSHTLSQADNIQYSSRWRLGKLSVLLSEIAGSSIAWLLHGYLLSPGFPTGSLLLCDWVCDLCSCALRWTAISTRASSWCCLRLPSGFPMTLRMMGRWMDFFALIRLISWSNTDVISQKSSMKKAREWKRAKTFWTFWTLILFLYFPLFSRGQMGI